MDFAGKAVAHLAADPNYLSKTGRILFTCDLAKVKLMLWTLKVKTLHSQIFQEYGFVDNDGDIHDIRFSFTY